MKQFPINNRVYLEKYTKETLVATINSRYIIEKYAVIKRADRLLDNRYLFQNEWDMERTQDAVYMPLEGINWNAIPGKDMEWSYMFHRHGYLIDSVLAYVFTDDFNYIKYINSFLEQYIKENPLNSENQGFSWRTIDVGLRLQTWVRIVELYEILELSIAVEILETMEGYRDYLSNNLHYDRSQSNWVAIEASAIITHGVLVGISDDTQRAAVNIYDVCLENQVLNDGLQWEQSFMYHHEVLLTALQVTKALGKKTSAMVREKTQMMINASRMIMRPDYTQSNFGDSDYESMGSLLLASEKIYNVNLLTKPYVSTLFDFLLSGSDKDSLGKAPYRAIENFYLDEAGLSVHKNHELMTHFMFSNGPLGGGHGHDDFLHFDFMIKGEDILVDSGRYTYHEESGSRLNYKKPHAHNVPILNDTSYNHHVDSWSSSKVIEGLNQKTRFGSKISFFSGGHFGYSTANKNIYVNRKTILIEGSIIINIDSVNSTEAEVLTTNYVFPKDTLSLIQDDIIYRLDNNKKYTIKSISEDVDLALMNTNVSPQYNKAIQTKRALFTKTMAKGNIITMIFPETVAQISSVSVYDDRGQMYSKKTVECFKYRYKDKDAYLLVQHLEPDDSRRAYCIEGHLFYGRLIYVEKVNHEIIYKEKLF